ncbi:hypothetical protein PL321_11615 [Caloramator sp. mosi_1]|uniref:hypothetical protein n=1 Tax=Caloramator sp. mosi_1 TaxID=3023090 RepID=UPI00235FCE2C|nr:hypothetical protein [Caloramator sp. mosi_1]WDC83391.1 hypothetical protein PL321_11615 [Caloramator sp. mosi_1]
MAAISNITKEIDICIRDNATKVQDQEEYMRRYNALVAIYENIRKAIEEVENERFERIVKKDRIEEFIKVLKRRDVLLDEFDGELWNMVIGAVKVYSGGKMVFVFKDGMEMIM